MKKMKYFLANSDKEVKIGDTIPIKLDVDTPFGNATAIIHVVLTEDNLDKLLIGNHIRKEKKLTVDTCIEILSDKLSITVEETKALLIGMLESGMMQSTAVHMLLMAASEYLSPSIKEVKALPQVYTISLVNGRIYTVQTCDISTYRHFPYFVSKTQAKYVKAMLNDVFSEMYGK